MKLVLLTSGSACLDAIEGLYLLTDAQRKQVTMLEDQEGVLGAEQLHFSRETQIDQIRSHDVKQEKIRRQIQVVITSGIKIPYEDYGINRLLI